MRKRNKLPFWASEWEMELTRLHARLNREGKEAFLTYLKRCSKYGVHSTDDIYAAARGIVLTNVSHLRGKKQDGAAAVIWRELFNVLRDLYVAPEEVMSKEIAKMEDVLF